MFCKTFSVNCFSNCYFFNYFFMHVETNIIKNLVSLAALFDLIFHSTISIEVNKYKQ